MKKFFALVLTLVMVTISISAVAESTPVFGKIYHNSVEVGNVFDNHRVTITTGEILFPGVGPGNYSQNQLDEIESRWVEFKIVPNGTMPVVFAGGLKINGRTYNAGVAAYIGGEPQTVQIRDGELVLWDLLEDMHNDIALRMEPQILHGNLDIHQELAFKACSPEVAGYFTPELLKNNGVKIVDITK